jgi:hypothetical protein
MQKLIPKRQGDHLFCATTIESLPQSRQASNQDTYRQENANLCAIYPVVNSRGESSGGAPSAVSDTTERLEVVPVRELVFFRGGRHVCADDGDGEVGHFGDGDFGAVEL